MSTYDNESYLNSLNASRGDVDRNVANTLTEIGRQQGVAQQQVGQLDQATSSIFGQGRANVQSDVAGLQNVLGGASQGMGAQRQLDPSLTLNALSGQQAAYAAATPLLGQGFQEQAAQRSGKVQSIASSLMADIDGKRNEYISRREAEDRANAFESQESQQSRIAQENMLRYQMDVSQQAQNYALQSQAREAELQRRFEAEQANLGRVQLANLANPPQREMTALERYELLSRPNY